MTTNNESVGEDNIETIASMLHQFHNLNFPFKVSWEMAGEMERVGFRGIAHWHITKTKTLMEQVEVASEDRDEFELKYLSSKGLAEALTLKLEQAQAENVRLHERMEGMRSAILFAINSGVIWKRQVLTCECNHCKVSEMFEKSLAIESDKEKQ